MWGIAALIIIIAVIVLAAFLRNGSTSQKWQTQYDLGIRFLADGDYEQAVIAFEAAISIDPKNADAYDAQPMDI